MLIKNDCINWSIMADGGHHVCLHCSGDIRAARFMNTKTQ